MTFTFKDNTYNFIWFTDLKTEDLPPRKTYKQSKFLDLGCGFDIETSRIGNEKLSTMYVWQFAINEITILGRTWQEFRDLLDMLAAYYKPTSKQRLLVFIHNASFEWQFLKGQIELLNERKQPSVFAIEDRKIVKFTTKHYIEFRDSAILTQMSLDKLAKNYNLSVKKLKEDTNFDYDLPRHSETELTHEELAYCINDVQILADFYHKYIKREFIQKQHKVPLTSTGIVREELRRAWKKWNKRERLRYKRLLEKSFPEFEQYVKMIQWLYRGGFTHANASLTGDTFDSFDMHLRIGAYDLKSSYPASLLHHKYPMRFIERPTEWFYKYSNDYKFINDYAFYGTFTFKNIRAKTQHSIESKNKLMEYTDCYFDNGRLLSGQYIKVMLNEIDYLNYKDFYEWDSVECLDFYVADKVELPCYVKDLILQYFYYKETEKDKFLRTLVKYKLNGIYGMMVSGLLHNSLIYNPETLMFDLSDPTQSYEQIISKEILLPQWGIWCTSYSRQSILYAMKSVGNDAIYSDTDSCKLLDADAYKYVFDSYNDVMHRINKTMYVGKFERDIFNELGCFEDETMETGRIIKFKTLGAKRYVYSTIDGGNIHHNVTVAGMKKGSLQAYCEKNNKDIYALFNDKLTLSEEDSGKLTTSYEDVYFERDFTDYKGNTIKVSEKSCVTLYKIPFAMTLTQDYLDLLYNIALLNQKKVIKRVY